MQFQKGTIIVRHDATYPKGALVVSGYSETGELLAYPKGGGAEFRIPASDVTKFSAVTEGEQTPIYRRSSFALEGIGETFFGWSNGESWNGWAMPKFAFDHRRGSGHSFKQCPNVDGDHRMTPPVLPNCRHRRGGCFLLSSCERVTTKEAV